MVSRFLAIVGLALALICAVDAFSGVRSTRAVLVLAKHPIPLTRARTWARGVFRGVSRARSGGLTGSNGAADRASAHAPWPFFASQVAYQPRADGARGL